MIDRGLPSWRDVLRDSVILLLLGALYLGYAIFVVGIGDPGPSPRPVRLENLLDRKVIVDVDYQHIASGVKLCRLDGHASIDLPAPKINQDEYPVYDTRMKLIGCVSVQVSYEDRGAPLVVRVSRGCLGQKPMAKKRP